MNKILLFAIGLAIFSSCTENKKSISVSIQKDLVFYIDQNEVKFQNLESELIKLLQNKTAPALVLRAEKSVPVDYVVKVMDIANRNKFKIILAVNPN